MFNAKMLIDFIQGSKKQFVNATVMNEKVKTGLNQFVDDQTKMTHTIVDNAVLITRESLYPDEK